MRSCAGKQRLSLRILIGRRRTGCRFRQRQVFQFGPIQQDGRLRSGHRDTGRGKLLPQHDARGRVGLLACLRMGRFMASQRPPHPQQ
ncbi:hypothetical protein Xthr_05825 [Xanthomonas citri pv. thirumalacharii]|nr:hypothetical protein [Xanthomonas citri pv. thirumalacharii]